MTKEILNEFATVNAKIFDLQKKLDFFTKLLNERQQGDIDYLAMETGVDLNIGEDDEE